MSGSTAMVHTTGARKFRDHAPPVVDGLAGDQRRRRSCRVVDEQIDRAEALMRESQDMCRERVVADITDDGLAAHSLVGHQRCSLGESFGRTRHQHDVRSGGGEVDGEVTVEPAAAPSHNRDGTCQRSIRCRHQRPPRMALTPEDQRPNRTATVKTSKTAGPCRCPLLADPERQLSGASPDPGRSVVGGGANVSGLVGLLGRPPPGKGSVPQAYEACLASLAPIPFS